VGKILIEVLLGEILIEVLLGEILMKVLMGEILKVAILMEVLLGEILIEVLLGEILLAVLTGEILKVAVLLIEVGTAEASLMKMDTGIMSGTALVAVNLNGALLPLALRVALLPACHLHIICLLLPRTIARLQLLCIVLYPMHRRSPLARCPSLHVRHRILRAVRLPHAILRLV